MAKQKQSAKPGIMPGDEVFFSHEGNHVAGKVLAHGEHGCTIDHDGERRRVYWSDVLGHKKRADLAGKMVDQGDDGFIVEDSYGRRRFVAGDIPEFKREDTEEDHAQISIDIKNGTPMSKSLNGEMLLFFKGGPIANRPGLSKKEITDSRGRRTTRWVRNTQDPESSKDAKPAIQAGSRVKYKAGDHSGEGQVTAVGKHGATVADSTGREHQVLHHEITHYEDDRAGANAGEPAKLFTEEDLAKLPEKAFQPAHSWEELVEKGTEGLNQFRDQLGKVAEIMGLQSGKKPEDITPEEWENDKGFLFLAPLKGEKRAREKVEADYKGDWSQLRDIVRATISVPGMSNVTEALSHLKSVGIELAQKPKDRFSKPTDEGYRDLMTIVKLPNGMLAELQIHVKAMTLAKEHGHKDYEVTRSLCAKYDEPKPSDKWSPEDKEKYETAFNAQRKLYDTVWTKAAGGGSDKAQASEKPMQKAVVSSKMIMLFMRRHDALEIT